MFKSVYIVILSLRLKTMLISPKTLNKCCKATLYKFFIKNVLMIFK